MKLASWLCHVVRLRPVVVRVEWRGEAESGMLVMKVMNVEVRCHVMPKQNLPIDHHMLSERFL